MSEFTDAELAMIGEMLQQRYRKEVEMHLADSEIDLHNRSAGDSGDPAQRPRHQQHAAPLSCPTVYWHARGANFVVFKIAPRRYRTQFFYTPHEQFGTGIEEYSNLDECVAAVLQMQADHERQREPADATTR